MLNKFRIYVITAFSAVLFFSCSSCRESLTDLTGQGYIKAEIKDYRGLDGCTFLIQPENGNRLEPIGLPDEYRVDGLAVWVKYKDPDKPMASICMSGTMVQIIDIRKR